MNGERPLGGSDRSLAKNRSERMGRLVISGLFTLPLLADLVAQSLGFEVFYLADSKLQAVWGTLVQLVGGWPLYTDALRQFRRGKQGRALGIGLLSTLLYAFGLYAAVARPGAGGFFLGSASLILFGYLADYLESRT